MISEYILYLRISKFFRLSENFDEANGKISDLLIKAKPEVQPGVKRHLTKNCYQ